MVGLSVVLEAAGGGGYNNNNNNNNSNKKAPQVISKYSTIMITPSSSSSTAAFNGRKSCYDLKSFSATDDFLQYCFLCKQKLLPAKDIYMYKGEMGFCSEECRCRKIVMDQQQEQEPEEEISCRSSRSGTILMKPPLPHPHHQQPPSSN